VYSSTVATHERKVNKAKPTATPPRVSENILLNVLAILNWHIIDIVHACMNSEFIITPSHQRLFKRKRLVRASRWMPLAVCIHINYICHFRVYVAG
jgi:hypothetical protein